ncbi:ACT domain-containing protein [Photobacterium leiognathi]|uniref:ACT domain-containing protein n=1 Tax=Photobacterium leiognathi TaxID=553611 RepID=UPI0029824B6A|nr:ACT domain-containing protein [Photobacterium leiognathi]
MSGITDLSELLANLQPVLSPTSYIFCFTENTNLDAIASMSPLATFHEEEGMTFILNHESAVQHNIEINNVYRCITLKVHSSLEAVGLTAAVSSVLAKRGISANVMAAFYHDHIFVHEDHAEQAMLALTELSESVKHQQGESI